MDTGNHVYHITNGNSGKNGSIHSKIHILEIPQNEDLLITFMFNEELNLIESNLLNENSSSFRKYQINSFPAEKCNRWIK